MKTIIRKGTNCITICKHCGCIFEYESEDVLTRIAWDENDKHTLDMTHCPQCKFTVLLSDRKEE